jgi:hypothetical protein
MPVQDVSCRSSGLGKHKKLTWKHKSPLVSGSQCARREYPSVTVPASLHCLHVRGVQAG